MSKEITGSYSYLKNDEHDVNKVINWRARCYKNEPQEEVERWYACLDIVAKDVDKFGIEYNATNRLGLLKQVIQILRDSFGDDLMLVAAPGWFLWISLSCSKCYNI